MSVSRKLESYLKEHRVRYKSVRHPHSGSSLDTAQAAHVPGDLLAKAVVVSPDGRYLMVVVPSAYHVDLERLQGYVGEPVQLATETELAKLFPDCEPGAVPPVGIAYELKTLVDRRLLRMPEIYLESGDHEHLIKLDGGEFAILMEGAVEVDVGRHI